MVLTRAFQETVRERAQTDPAYRIAMLSEAAEELLAGQAASARSILRSYINATLGFETLAAETGIAVKSLHRMFSARGNPTLSNLTRVLQTLEAHEGVSLEVTARPSTKLLV
ncbi:putative transcriptional regulator [Salinisphaera sp. PC39]|uniref:helix-turn-helix domain-containing transcriptional regulator n=1 Tax=Salinisphaera sp. PC39 TaxID=1304156 RepID=UPI0033411A9D